MGYKVVDNFLENDVFKELQNIMLGDNFPWYYNDYVTREEDVNGIKEYQLTHVFFKDNEINSGFFNILDSVFDAIDPNILLRVKANLVPHTEKIFEHDWHVDLPGTKCKTAILYLNSNNGYTLFKDSDEKIDSVENRFVSFDSDMEHRGSTCTDSKVRAVINFNYI